MKKLYLAVICLLSAYYQGFAQTHTSRAGVVTCPISNGYYEFLPQGYFDNPTEKFPLIIFIPGIAELGNGTTELSTVLRHGPANLINTGQWPAKFTVNGQDFKFIVITPQFTVNPWSGHINTMLDYIIANYKVDIDRIYMSGFSLGGGAVWAYAGASTTYANRLAAIAPGAGALQPTASFCSNMAAANLPILALHNNADAVVPVSNTHYFVDNTNAAHIPTPIAQKIIYYGIVGHDLTHGFSLNLNVYGYSGFADMNVYNWMLKSKRNIAALPVKFTGFSVSKQNSRALVQWSTASEVNNQGFDVLRSANGSSWESIAFINSLGSNGASYTYTDAQPLTGKNYYRIRQKDFDGKTSVSEIRFVDFQKQGYIQLAANPVQTELKLNTDLNFENAQLNIYNAGGQLIKKELINGTGQISILLGIDNPGTYIAEIMNGSSRQSIRFVKQ